MAAFVPTSFSRGQSLARSSFPSSSLSAMSSPFDTMVQQTPSFSLADAAAAVTILPSGETFEPILPDSSTLIAFGSIIVLSALAFWVWANQVVPVSRTNLALSKKKGPVKDYLDELRAAENLVNSIDVTTINATAASMSDDASSANVESRTPTTRDTRALERWFFTDWLQKDNGSKPGRQKEPALPVLKNAKWNSGDNPVLVASALIMGGVLFTAVTERVASGIF
eukprot:scaffold40679_cov183-Amphora_coffeaeformis.AAC.3